MEYLKAGIEHLSDVSAIVQETIQTIYPNYYPQEAAAFFCQLHKEENIKKDILSGTVGILTDQNIIVGTGCHKDNHIARVYVHPKYQNRGYGSYLMDCLEREISKDFDRVCLDASLPASHLYEKRGYHTIEHCRIPLENGAVLVYEVMEKTIGKNKKSCFGDCFRNENSILMEGALGERLKREYHIRFDENVAMGSLVYTERGRTALEDLWSEYAKIAHDYQLPFLATTPTRRTNKERTLQSGYDTGIIGENVRFLRQVQEKQNTLMYVGGLMGCKGDAYTGKGALDLASARKFHDWEIKLFAQAGVDFLYAALMPALEEAAGIALAIETYRIPYIISFTIKNDGCLIDGTHISDAIQYIDGITAFHPVCYMTNCVHPRIVYEALSQPFNQNDLVRDRFCGIQANTSALSYDELDESKDLKTSVPVELAEEMATLREIIPFKIFGGCCGTDGRHMREIAKRI